MLRAANRGSRSIRYASSRRCRRINCVKVTPSLSNSLCTYRGVTRWRAATAATVSAQSSRLAVMSRLIASNQAARTPRCLRGNDAIPRCSNAQRDQIAQMCGDQTRNLGRDQRVTVDECADVLGQEFQAVRLTRDHAHYGTIKPGHEGGQRPAGHAQSDKPPGRRAGDGEGTFRAAQKDSIAVIDHDLALPLQSRAATGEIQSEEKIVGGSLPGSLLAQSAQARSSAISP